MNTDESHQRRLTDYPPGNWQPAFSPDGRRIAFARAKEGRAEIHLMNADGRNVVQLTTSGGFHPSWSPDGKRIAYASFGQKVNGRNPFQIFMMNSDGSHTSMLTNDADTSVEPVWSPDGRKIFFRRVVGKLEEKISLFAIDSDGKNVRRLTAAPALDGCPSVSPNGSKVTFHSNRDGNYEIYVMNLDRG